MLRARGASAGAVLRVTESQVHQPKLQARGKISAEESELVLDSNRKRVCAWSLC